jgi:hypothetical protein
MSRSASRLGVLLLAVALAAGCGGAGDRAARVPRLPADVARVLAAQSDALAVSLERNDACTAARRAADLRKAANAAVASGRVPVAFRRKLAGAVTRLTAAVQACTPPDEDEDEGGGHDNGKHKGKGKHGGKGKD